MIGGENRPKAINQVQEWSQRINSLRSGVLRPLLSLIPHLRASLLIPLFNPMEAGDIKSPALCECRERQTSDSARGMTSFCHSYPGWKFIILPAIAFTMHFLCWEAISRCPPAPFTHHTSSDNKHQTQRLWVLSYWLFDWQKSSSSTNASVGAIHKVLITSN